MAFIGILLFNILLLLFFGGIILGVILLLIGIFAHKTILKIISLIILVPSFIILLIVGIKVKIKKHENMKKLYYCLENEYYKQAEKLFENGISVNFTIRSNEPAKNGERTYFINLCEITSGDSRYEKSGEKIQFLIDHGADIEYRLSVNGHEKDNPSHFADKENKCVQYSPSYGDICGSTPLMCAARAGNVNAVKVLLDNGADVNAVSYCGETALMCACCMNGENGVEIIELLLEKGANINAENNFGLTVMDYAKYFNQSRAEKKLKKYINQ